MNTLDALKFIGTDQDARFVMAKLIDGVCTPRQGYLDFTLVRDQFGNLGVIPIDVVEKMSAAGQPLPRTHEHVALACNHSIVEWIREIRTSLYCLAEAWEHEQAERALDASLS